VVRRIVDDRSARREDETAATCEQLLEHLALEPAVVRLAVEREQLAEREAGSGFDLLIELDERHVEPLRERCTDRRLAGAAHAEQGDRASIGRGFGGGEERRGGGTERMRDLGEAPQRDVAVTGLELREKPLGDSRLFGELPARP